MSVGSLGAGSGLDLESLVKQMVSAQKDAKVGLYQNKINGYESELSALGKVGSAIDNFKSSVKTLNDDELFTGRDAKIAQKEGEEVISITTDSSASNGSYSIDVNQLAKGSRVMSAPGLFSSPDDVISDQDAKLTFTAGSNEFSIDVKAGTTLSQLRNQVNTSADNFGVSVNLVDDGAGNLFFTATSAIQGAENSLRISNDVIVRDEDGNIIESTPVTIEEEPELEELPEPDPVDEVDELDLEEAMYVIKLLDSETTSDVLMELDEDNREKVLKNLSAKEIAEEVEELDTDDAADIISELPEDRQQEVISNIEDEEHQAEIRELLAYDEDTAGGLMAKELVKVYETWTVAGCLRRIRGQAKDVTRVHSIYVVNKQNKLVGRLSLKDLIVAKSDQKISDIYIKSVDSVNVHDDAEDVVKVMQKYDLEAIPVVDNYQRLIGRITIDDIVDVMKEEAEKDYQLAAGITSDVEADDSIWELTKGRLPWLLIGMFGGLGAASIINGFNDAMLKFPMLLIFIPLIQATAGNVGVQSSAIVVQGLANDTIKGELLKRLFKEFLLGLVNGIAIACVVLVISHFVFHTTYLLSVTIGIALIVVIIMAALIGTFIPIFLDKQGVDPAVATGPFITTSNDIFGILLYFLIAKMILGF